MLSSKEEYTKMAAVEKSLWWYQALHELVAKAIDRFFPKNNPTIVDAGCGTGGCSLHLMNLGHKEIAGFDISPDAIELCQANGLNFKKGDLKEIDSYFGKNSKDIIICNDVLYFFNPDEVQQILRKFHRVLKPGGIAILNLPALKAFEGAHDISVGNPGNRFSKTSLKEMISSNEFTIRQSLFWPFFLSPLIYLVRLKQRLEMKMRNTESYQSDINLPPKWLNSLLLFVVRLENFLLPAKPWGSSLFVVLEAK